MVNHWEGHLIFQDIEDQLRENIPYHILNYSFFYKIFIKLLRSLFHPLQIIYRNLLQRCPTIEIIYIQILKIWRFFTFIIMFHIFVSSVCISIITVTYSFCFFFFFFFLLPFPSISNISISVKNSNFTTVFLILPRLVGGGGGLLGPQHQSFCNNFWMTF